MDHSRLAQTESELAVTDRLWRAEMRRTLDRMPCYAMASAPSVRGSQGPRFVKLSKLVARPSRLGVTSDSGLSEEPMDTRQPAIMEAIAEGAHARAIGLPKDSCPYHGDMPERQAWLDGYDGAPKEDGPDVPMADA